MDLLCRAVIFAAEVHDGVTRKASGSPYILHPLEAAAITGSMTNDPEVIAAAVLHDTVEDANVTAEELIEKFGERVARLVAAETEDKRREQKPSASWRIRKEEAIALLQGTSDIDVKMVVLGDKLANIRSLYRDYQRMGDALWSLFNQKDPRQHWWYYRTIADAMPELSHFMAWKEYDRLIYEIFEKPIEEGDENADRSRECDE